MQVSAEMMAAKQTAGSPTEIAPGFQRRTWSMSGASLGHAGAASRADNDCQVVGLSITGRQIALCIGPAAVLTPPAIAVAAITAP